MTKAELIGQVLLRVTGGTLSEDNSVWYSDIERLLVPAMNLVVLNQYYVDKQDEEGERILNPLLLTSYTVNLANDTQRNQTYITLPHRPVTLPRARAVPYVGTVRGKQFMPLENGSEALIEHYQKINSSTTLYQHEGTKIYFWNVSPAITSVRVNMLVNVSTLQDTDEIVLPSGGELKVMEILVEFITGQREIPEDIKVNFKNPKAE